MHGISQRPLRRRAAPGQGAVAMLSTVHGRRPGRTPSPLRDGAGLRGGAGGYCAAGAASFAVSSTWATLRWAACWALAPGGTSSAWSRCETSAVPGA